MFNDLINKKITETKWNDYEIVFYLESGDVIRFRAEGDCCNDVSINDIDDVEVLQDCIMIEAEQVEGGSFYDENEIQWVFYKFKTNKGYSTLSLRNTLGRSGYAYAGYLTQVRK